MVFAPVAIAVAVSTVGKAGRGKEGIGCGFQATYNLTGVTQCERVMAVHAQLLRASPHVPCKHRRHLEAYRDTPHIRLSQAC